MAVKPIPDGYHTITPFIVVKNIQGLIKFLKEALDAKEIFKMETPDGKVMHAEIKIGDSIIMMGESSDKYPPKTAALYVYVKDVDKTYKQAIKAGATSTMEPANQFYGDRTAGLSDDFGNTWWLGTHVEDVPPDEIKRREEEMRKNMNK